MDSIQYTDDHQRDPQDHTLAITDDDDSNESAVWHRSIRTFWLCALAIGLVLIGMIPVFTNGYIAFPDEGVYTAQAIALSHGTWAIDRPAPSFDTTGALDPLGSSAVVGNKRIPYSRHPAYSVLLSIAYRLGGLKGLLATSVLGAWCAGVATGLVARRWNKSYGLPALLLCTLGSPILFNSFIVAAHSIAAALSAVILLLILRAVVDQRNWAMICTAIPALLLPMMRSEGAILIAALCGTLIVLAAILHESKFIKPRMLLTGVVIGSFGLLGYLIDIRLSRSVSTVISSIYTDPVGSIGGRQTDLIGGTWIALFQPWSEQITATPWLPFGLLCVVLGALLLRILPAKHAQFIVPVLFVASCTAIITLTTINRPIPGLLPSMPVLIFGPAFLSRKSLVGVETKILCGVTFVGILGLCLTIHGDGGALQWGGRFFQILLPELIVLSLIGINLALGRLLVAAQASTLLALVVLTIALSISGLRLNYSLRSGFKRIVTSTALAAERILDHSAVPRNRTLILLAQSESNGTTRGLWQHDVQLNLLSVPFRGLYSILSEARFDRYERIYVLSNAPEPAFEVLNQALRKDHGLQISANSIAPDWLPTSFVYAGPRSTHKG